MSSAGLGPCRSSEATHIGAMSLRERWAALGKVPAVRTGLIALGLMLMAAAPVAGLLPGPGGIFVFAAGLALTLRYSEWAKRKYVAFKRRHPRKGDWADWGLRRRSAQRRVERRKQEVASGGPRDD